jgi:hypothetical protein
MDEPEVKVSNFAVRGLKRAWALLLYKVGVWFDWLTDPDMLD